MIGPRVPRHASLAAKCAKAWPIHTQLVLAGPGDDRIQAATHSLEIARTGSGAGIDNRLRFQTMNPDFPPRFSRPCRLAGVLERRRGDVFHAFGQARRHLPFARDR